MAYIFLDESGDLGFDLTKKKTSKNFVITLLFSNEKDPLDKIVKKIFHNFSPKIKKSHSNTLHCYRETAKTRKELLTNLLSKDVRVISIYLNKKKVYTKLQNERHVLYNYVTNILLDRLLTKKIIPLNRPICLIASKRETNKFLNENFRTYLHSQIRLNHKLDIEILIKTPSQEKGLQVVDFVCWAIFRKLEHHDSSYYDLIKQKIVEENLLFP